MKTLVLAKFAPDTHGGIETSIRTFADAFARSCPSDQMHIVCYGGIRRDYLLHHNVRCSVYRCSAVLFSSPISFLQATEVYLHRSDYDVVHLHLPNPWSLLVALFLLSNISSVVTVHAVATRYPILEVFERRLRNALLKHCSAIIVAAEPNIAQFGLTAFAHKTRIIPFAPDRALVSMTDRTEATYTPPLPIPYMLFVGRLVHYKGLETFLPLMQHIHGYLVIAGDGPLYHSLSSLANSLSISSKVVLCGAVTDEELASLLRQALFCIMPSVSRSETFGIAALEAMACGKAVVVSRIGTGLDTLVHEGINGYSVDPSDPERWIDVCNHLFDDPALAQTLGFNGQNIAATKYSDTDTHDRVLALLNDANLRGCHCSQ